MENTVDAILKMMGKIDSSFPEKNIICESEDDNIETTDNLNTDADNTTLDTDANNTTLNEPESEKQSMDKQDNGNTHTDSEQSIIDKLKQQKELLNSKGIEEIKSMAETFKTISNEADNIIRTEIELSNGDSEEDEYNDEQQDIIPAEEVNFNEKTTFIEYYTAIKIASLKIAQKCESSDVNGALDDFLNLSIIFNEENHNDLFEKTVKSGDYTYEYAKRDLKTIEDGLYKLIQNIKNKQTYNSNIDVKKSFISQIAYFLRKLINMSTMPLYITNVRQYSGSENDNDYNIKSYFEGVDVNESWFTTKYTDNKLNEVLDIALKIGRPKDADKNFQLIKDRIIFNDNYTLASVCINLRNMLIGNVPNITEGTRIEMAKNCVPEECNITRSLIYAYTGVIYGGVRRKYDNSSRDFIFKLSGVNDVHSFNSNSMIVNEARIAPKLVKDFIFSPTFDDPIENNSQEKSMELFVQMLNNSKNNNNVGTIKDFIEKLKEFFGDLTSDELNEAAKYIDKGKKINSFGKDIDVSGEGVLGYKKLSHAMYASTYEKLLYIITSFCRDSEISYGRDNEFSDVVEDLNRKSKVYSQFKSMVDLNGFDIPFVYLLKDSKLNEICDYIKEKDEEDRTPFEKKFIKLCEDKNYTDENSVIEVMEEIAFGNKRCSKIQNDVYDAMSSIYPEISWGTEANRNDKSLQSGDKNKVIEDELKNIIGVKSVDIFGIVKDGNNIKQKIAIEVQGMQHITPMCMNGVEYFGRKNEFVFNNTNVTSNWTNVMESIGDNLNSINEKNFNSDTVKSESLPIVNALSKNGIQMKSKIKSYRWNSDVIDVNSPRRWMAEVETLRQQFNDKGKYAALHNNGWIVIYPYEEWRSSVKFEIEDNKKDVNLIWPNSDDPIANMASVPIATNFNAAEFYTNENGDKSNILKFNNGNNSTLTESYYNCFVRWSRAKGKLKAVKEALGNKVRELLGKKSDNIETNLNEEKIKYMQKLVFETLSKEKNGDYL